MKYLAYILAGAASLLATGALAQDSVKADAPPAAPAWEFAITAFPTSIRNGENYTSGVATADKGHLHLEARVNYESIGARSAFIGWNFSGGEEVTWTLTPLIGGAWGSTKAVIPGFEASLAWKRLDFYIEAEYVHDKNAKDSSYTYAWSEVGFSPVEWFRLGVVAQRTRAYGGSRDIQRGPFAQVTWNKLTLGAFWFNPGSSEQVFVGSIGVSF